MKARYITFSLLVVALAGFSFYGAKVIAGYTANVTITNSISNGLVGHWTFDGKDVDWATGNVADVSGTGNNGTIVSMATSSAPTVGIQGQAFDFDGTNDYVNTGLEAGRSVCLVVCF